MATIAKPTQPVKPSVNPKIATTILAKPATKKAPVSKLSNSVSVKKSTSITSKAASDETVKPVKLTTTLKSNPKPVAPSLPKTIVKPSVPAKTTTIKSAADSTTSLKSKPVTKSLVKPTAPPAKSISATKSVVAKPVLKKAQPTANSEVKKAPVTTVKSSALSKPVAAKSTQAPVTTVKSSTLSKPVAAKSTQAPITTVKSSALSKPVAAKSTLLEAKSPKTSPSFASSTPIKTKTSSILNAHSTPTKPKSNSTFVAKTSPKVTSPSLSKSPMKSSTTNVKTSSKPSTALKPIKKPATLTSTKKISTRPSLNPNDVIKRLQDESEIEIRDADSTTVEEEKDNEFSSTSNDSNGNFEERSEAVDEQRVYAVAEQLIGVMQPEELEVITADVPEQPARDSNSCIIDMSALETEESDRNVSNNSETKDLAPLVDESPAVEDSLNEQITVIETQDDEVLIEISGETVSESCTLQDSLDEETTFVETFDNQVLTDISKETENITAFEEQEILEMYERKVQELTDFYRGTVDIPVVFENRAENLTKINGECENNSQLNIFENGEETESTECSEMTVVNEVDEDCVNISTSAVAIEDGLQESVLTTDSEPSEDLIPTVFIEEKIELENSHIFNFEPTASVKIEFSSESLVESTFYLEEADISNSLRDEVSGNQIEANIEQELEENEPWTSMVVNASNEKNQSEGSQELFDPEINNFCIVSESDNDAMIFMEHSEEISKDNVPELINLESDVDEKVYDEISVFEDNFGYEEGVSACIDEDTFTIVSQNSTIDSKMTMTAEDQIIFTHQNTEGDSTITNDEGEYSDGTDMSYAEAVQSLKILTDDILESARGMSENHELYILGENAVKIIPSTEIDETSNQANTPAVDSSVIHADIPIISMYDAAEFPDSVPSDEHYEKQEDQEVDQHDESFHKIRHKRNKRRNKKNRKSNNAENFDDHTSPKNVHGEKQIYEENYPVEYHGRRRNSRRWRNSRSYFEAFHQHQLPHNQEYYADPHWKFTPKMD